MLRVFLVIDDYNELIYLQTLLKKLGFDVEGLQNPKKYADLSLGFNPQVLITTARGKVVDGVALAKNVRKRNGSPKIIALKSHEVNLSSETLEEAGIDMVVETPINPKRLILALATIGSLDENVMFEKFSKMKGLNQPAGGDPHVHVKYDDNGQPVEDLNKLKMNISELTGAPKAASEPMFPIDKKPVGDKVAAAESQFNVQKATNEIEPSGTLNYAKANAEKRVTPESDPERLKRFERWQNEIGPLPKKNFDRERILAFNKKIRATPLPDDIDDIEDQRKLFVKTLFSKSGR